MTIEEIKKKALPVLLRSGVEFAAVFGSVARGEMTKKSDIDILVRFNPEVEAELSLLDHIGIAQELEDIFGRKVDLISEDTLKPAVAPYVKEDLTPLYGQVQRPDLL